MDVLDRLYTRIEDAGIRIPYDFIFQTSWLCAVWFDAYVMDANNLVDKLVKPPSLDKQALRSKVNELIGEYTKGEDAGKLRIIVKK